MKTEMSEQEAIGRMFLSVFQGIQSKWPEINASFAEMFRGKVVLDDVMAMYDFALATIALNIKPIDNLFPKPQGERLKGLIINHLSQMNKETMGTYALDEVMSYRKELEINLERIKGGESPLDAISIRLLKRWLGDNLGKFEVELNGKKTGHIAPLLVMLVTEKVVGFIGFWKHISENFNLIEDAPPLDDKALGLKDYSPEPSDNKPDGTIKYYDNKGKLCEKWIPPAEIVKMLAKGSLKRVYKVLIKGPWDGVKQTYWELSDENVKTFVDENEYAYALCANPKGEAEYMLMRKKIWENMDKVTEIMLDTNLSELQRVESIRKMGED